MRQEHLITQKAPLRKGVLNKSKVKSKNDIDNRFFFTFLFAFLRGHYPEQVHRVNSQLGPKFPAGLSLPWLIQFSKKIIRKHRAAATIFFYRIFNLLVCRGSCIFRAFLCSRRWNLISIAVFSTIRTSSSAAGEPSAIIQNPPTMIVMCIIKTLE